MTRRVKGKVDSDDTLRHLVDADTGTVCIVGKCWDYHVLEALGTTLDEGVAMVADSIAYLKELGRDGPVRRRALLRRLPRQPRVQPAGARGRGAGGRRPARAVRHERRQPAGRRRGDGPVRSCGYLGPDVADRRAPARRHRLRRRQRARRRARRCDAGAGDDQRLRRAHRELQPHDDHPEPHGEDGDRDAAAGPAGAAHPGRAPRGRAREHGAQPAGRVRGQLGVRAQGRAARRARSRSDPTRTSTSRRTPWATARGS